MRGHIGASANLISPRSLEKVQGIGGWSLTLEYTDDTEDFRTGDQGEYKWRGVDGGVRLDFTSELYGDEFVGAAARGV